MRQQLLLRRFARHLVGSVLATATIALAQQPPDAGTILREQPKPPAAVTPKPAVKLLDKPAPKPAVEGPRVLVKVIRFKGNTLIAEAELVRFVADMIGKEVTFADLQNATLDLIGYYAERGYLARVFMPPQEIKDGEILFEVVEGTRGSIEIQQRAGQRVDPARVRRFVEERVPAGQPLNVDTLAEALTILNEQPGVSATSSLSPGEGERQVNVNVAASDRPLVAYNLGLNNHGSRGSGIVQGSAGAAIANPTGNFDAASLLINAAEGTAYGRGEYSLAVGDRGLRLGVNASALRYRLVQPAFTALQSRGTAETIGLTASYPLARFTEFGLSVIGSADSKKLVDRTVAGETGNRHVRVASAGLTGYAVLDPETIGGMLTFGVTATVGDSDQRNAGALAADQAARRTQGNFTKLAWTGGLLRPIDNNWTFTGTARGQKPGKNLESSERFGLGGPSGVRAYPAGEGAGDGGWLVSLALARRIGEGLRLGGFIDTGSVTINHSIPAGTTASNRYSLSGAGISLDWQPAPQALVTILLAAPIGNNPAKDANGNNADGTNANRPRLWLSFTALF